MAAPPNSTTFSGDVWADLRLADARDVPHIHRLIHQMADFEHLTDLFAATEELLTTTLFPSPTPPPFTSFTALILDLSRSPIVPDSSSTIASRRFDLSASPLADPEAAAFASPRGGGRVTAGFVICFPNYSTFLSKPGLYVEDIFVRAPWRRRGLGRMMLSAVAGRAAEIGMGRVEWCVLDWNKNAIDFYEGMGADVLPQWRICRLAGAALDKYKGSQEEATGGKAAAAEMDPTQSNVGEGSQGQFPGAHTGAYLPGEGSQGQIPGANMSTFQPAWKQYMNGYPPPPGFTPRRFQPHPHNVGVKYTSVFAPAGFQQTQTTETSTQDCDAALEEVVPTTKKAMPKKSSLRTKLGNFNPDEDKNIVKSWLEISCDPITSTGQKRERMWQRIMDRYNLRRGSNPVRSLRSIQSRWDTIRAEVTLFASYYADSIQENPSGMSDADKTTHAVGNFTAGQQRKFSYLHCWELMKDAPKWQNASARDIATAARGEGFGEDTIASTDTMEPGRGQSSPIRSGGQPQRPMGRDAAKAAKKKENTDAGSSSSAEYAARMQDLSLQRNTIMQDRSEEMRINNEAMIQIEQSKLQFMREQHEDAKRRHEEEKLKEEKKEDERILSIDLDACQPALRTYYQICQQEILERQAARRRRSGGP